MYTSKSALKFLFFSSVGIVLFFISFPLDGRSQPLVIHFINIARKAIGGEPTLNVIVMLCCVTVAITALLAKTTSILPAFLKEHHQHDSLSSYLMYFSAAIFSLMIFFGFGPSPILDPAVGKATFSIAGLVIMSISITGGFVVFLLDFGLLEFLGKMLEPTMRKLYRLPGKSSVDALASFVVSPAVGVGITNDLYRANTYTAKEACSIMTNFSIVSLSGYAYLTTLAGVGEYYGSIVLSSLVLVFVMAAIMIRLPPLSRKRHQFYDGSVQTETERQGSKYHRGLVKEAFAAGVEKASQTESSIILTRGKNSLLFAQKVCAYIVSFSVIGLIIAKYTPIVDAMGSVMLPILELLHIPDADKVAPTVLVGVFALSLPVTLIKGTAISAMAGYFVVVLSTTQIIFFTESANAMLDSEAPLGFLELLGLFFLRTLFLLPLVALFAHILF